ncbi:MAG: CBS domain-containing protein [Planctomycetales bacterium]
MKRPQETPRAGDYMNRHVRTVSPEMRLDAVVSFLLEHEVSNAPVVEERDGRRVLVGFISEHDCLEHLSNELFYGSPSQPQSAATIMRKHPVCVEPDTELFTLASILVNHRMRHLPVVADGELLGIVSRADILKALDEYYREYVAGRERERHPPDIHELIHHRFIMSGR